MSETWSDAEMRGLYERFGPLVRRRCRTVLRDATLAEDACQNVFIKLMRHRAAFTLADSKLGWLYRVSDTTCFDMLRTRRSHLRLVDAAAVAPSPTRDGDPVEERQRAMAVLGALDEELQRIAIMHYVDELSQGDIAEALGCSRQTVNAKLAKLRELARTGER